MFGSENPIFEFRGPKGVPVQIQPSLFLLVLLLVSFGGSPEDIMYDLAFVAMLLGSIFAHELGHAWGCLIQGVPVRRVVLYGGGGFCEHGKSTTPYEQELIVAMGPIVNLAIWAIAALVAPGLGYTTVGWAVETLAYINLFLAILNLIPVHPLDGGKLFELALMRVLPVDMASRISGAVGFVIAVLWVPLMVLFYFTFGLVLIFFPPIRAHWMKLRGA